MAKGTDVIRIKNALFYAYHGVGTDEQTLGGKFEVDVDLVCDLSRGARTDHLKDTVDYVQVYDTIREAVTGRKYFLLEALGAAIAGNILKKFRQVQHVTIRVRKPGVPIKGVLDSIEVELSRKRGRGK